MTDQTKLTAAFKELDYEDEAFGEIERAQQRRVAHGVTDGSVQPTQRNDVLEEVAKEFDGMTSLGDTAASFACYVRGMKS
jgi:hypothetical protein